MTVKYLSENKELMKFWDWNANTEFNPKEITEGSHKLIWWKCPKCGYKWCQAVVDISRNKIESYCPSCTNRVLIKGKNDLISTYPEIAKEWDFSKNKNLTPDNVTFKYCKKVWWICPKGHSYEQRIDNRTLRHTGCPYCSSIWVLKGFNDLATTNPSLAKEWHPIKNGNLTPYEVTANSTKKVWWLCPVGHEYMRSVHQRHAAYTNCPVCDSRKRTSFPEQAVYFYLKKLYPDTISRYKIKNTANMELDIYIPSIQFAVEYDGASWHKTEDSHSREIRKYQLCKELGITLIRIKEKNGTYWNDVCDNAYYIKPVKRNNLYELEKIIHYVLNSICSSIDDLIEATKINFNPLDDSKNIQPIPLLKPFKLFHHKIDVDLERDKNEIQGYVFKIENSLADLRPDIAKKWNYEKNGNLTPEMFSIGSEEIVWWKCPKCGHEWKISINSMTGKKRGNGCAVCAKTERAKKNIITKIKNGNSLAEKAPRKAELWHPTKNGKLTPYDITASSDKKIWWLCKKCGYEWQMSPHNRKKGKGCPHCAGKVPLVGIDDLATTHPTLAQEWNYEKNANLIPQDVKAGSDRAIWWKCPKCGYEWQAVIRFRVKGLCKCPRCSKKQLNFDF